MQDKIKTIKESNITKKTINTLMYEIVRIEGDKQKEKLNVQEYQMDVIYKFVTKLDGKIDNLYGGGIDKIITL